MTRSSRGRKMIGILLAIMAIVVVAGCAGKGGAGGANEKKTIKLADLQWQSMWINNAIGGFIFEHGYDHDVEIVEMTTPIMNQAVVKGDVDVVMETWTANIIDWFTDAKDNNKILVLGRSIEKGEVGWYVPRYVIEGDAARGIAATAPDLKSVFDLPKYKHLFTDPENRDKGLLISCITGWNCATQNRIKLHAYNLDEHYNIQEPGATAALDAAISAAYKRGEPILTYYWGPTWLLGTYDMVRLEEPANTQECDDLHQKMIKGDMAIEDAPPEAGCGFPRDEIFVTANPGLKDRAPGIVEFLDNYFLTTQQVNELSAHMELEKKSADETAIWFFENYQDVWRGWLPADVTAKVEAALKEAGANLQ